MKRLCIALALAVLLLLTAGVGTAMADTGEPAPEASLAEPAAEPAEQYTMEEDAAAAAPAPDLGALDQTNDATSSGTAGNLNAAKQDADQDQGSSGTQVIGQSAKNDQDALALALTVQKGAENVNAPVNVLSKGDSGDVNQENTATSDATAGNLNLTKQDADQEQSGTDCKCSDGGTQVIGQAADNDQKAAALAKTVQEKPSNTNVSIRVLSPGSNGDVTQTNTASSNATAGNVNLTKQDADQDQSGGDCKCSDGGAQYIGQSADSDQKAAAAAATVQEKPSNKNISIRVLSDGDDGDVTQTNTASSNATAGNVNLTKQDADQEQAGSGTQFIGQAAENDQKASALAGTVQEKPSNTNISIRVLSPGNGGNVTQSNTATSNATAGNLNALKQDADQDQGGGHDCKCSDGKQVIGQYAGSEQDATAAAATFQVKPSNTNTSIRVLSKGDDGDVTQTNTATSDATAANLNLTKQDADQDASGSGIQVIGQAAKNDQDATALAATFQLGASNTNAPVRVLSKGDGGDVTQSNTATSDADALNANLLWQDADQEQGGRKHHDKSPYGGKYEDRHDCCGTGIQVIGQYADSDQDAKAAALTVQAGIRKPCSCSHEPSFGNTNAPVRVDSKGTDGDVSQANTASSDADALNLNATKQDADQDQAGSCKCKDSLGIQVIGQLAKSEQDAFAAAATFQIGASNTNAPVSIGKGKGHKGHKGHGRNHRRQAE